MAYFELTFQKSADIRDKRFMLLYQVLFCLAIAFKLWKFIASRQWTRVALVTSRLYVNVSPESLYEAIFADRSGCPSHWHLSVNGTICPKFCALDQCNEECLPPMMSFREFTDGSQSVFLSSAFGIVSSTKEGGIEQRGAVRFFSSVDYLKVEFTYTYQPMYAPFELFIKHRAHGSSENALTVILDSKGRAYTTFEPGEKVLLSTTELLMVAQFPKHLLVPGNLSVLWELPGWARIHGVRLLAYVKCYNNAYDMPVDGFRPSTNRPSCLVRVEIVDTQASLTERVHGTEGMTRDMRGVFVRSQPSRCNFRFFDLSVCILNVTSAVVFLRLVTGFVRSILLSCLGTISQIYSAVVRFSFDIREQCAGVALRLMANSVSFVDLADQFEPGKSGISRRRMSERLSQALRDREAVLSEDEITSFVRFCHRQTVVSRTTRGSAGGAHDILYEVAAQISTEKLRNARMLIGKRQENWGRVETASQINIDVDQFNSICSSNEHLDFDSMVLLFDKDRLRGFLERLFTPSELWRSIHDVREQQEGEEHARDIGKQGLSRGCTTDSDLPADESPHHFHPRLEDRPSLSLGTAESSPVNSPGTTKTLEQEKVLQHEAVGKVVEAQVTVRGMMQRGRVQDRKIERAGGIVQGHCERQLAVLQDRSDCLGPGIHDRVVALQYEADMLAREVAARKEWAIMSESHVGERFHALEERTARLFEVYMPGVSERPTHASSSSASPRLATLELVCSALMDRASEAEAAAAQAEAAGAELRASLDILMAKHNALFAGSGQDGVSWDGHYYPEEEYVMSVQAAHRLTTAMTATPGMQVVEL